MGPGSDDITEALKTGDIDIIRLVIEKSNGADDNIDFEVLWSDTRTISDQTLDAIFALFNERESESGPTLEMINVAAGHKDVGFLQRHRGDDPSVVIEAAIRNRLWPIYRILSEDEAAIAFSGVSRQQDVC